MQEPSPYTLRYYRMGARSNVHLGTLSESVAVPGVYTIEAPPPILPELGCFQIYPAGERTFFEPFPKRIQLHVLYRVAASVTPHHLARIASHDQYIYFYLPSEATSICVVAAPSIKAAIEKVKLLTAT